MDGDQAYNDPCAGARLRYVESGADGGYAEKSSSEATRGLVPTTRVQGWTSIWMEADHLLRNQREWTVVERCVASVLQNSLGFQLLPDRDKHPNSIALSDSIHPINRDNVADHFAIILSASISSSNPTYPTAGPLLSV